MNTAGINSVWLRIALRRTVMFPLGAILLGGLLLFTWFTALAAGNQAVNPGTAQSLAQPPAQSAASLTEADEQPVYSPPPIFLGSSLLATTTLTSTAADEPPVDLLIKKTNLPTTFTVGTSNLYFINVNRVNTSTINEAVRIQDPLPSGVTWIPANSGKWNCTDTSSHSLVSCYYTENNPQTFDQISFRAIVAATAPSIITNTAYILNTDAVITNNQSTVVTPIDSVDLAILKTVYPENILNDETVTYTLVITNYGPMTARNVLVEDILSADMNYGVGIPSMGDYHSDGTWTIQSMNTDVTATLVITATPKPSAAGKLVVNTAKISSSNASDWYATNNTSSAQITVGGLDISKSVSQTSARVGENFRFTITVKNASASAINNVLVEDVINRGLDIISYYPGYYNAYTRKYSYATYSMAANSKINIVLTARATNVITIAQTITNVATVNWGPSYSIKNTSNEVGVLVQPGGSLQVSKTDGLTSVYPGQQVTYTVSITNTGNLNISSIKITDTLSSNMAYVALYPGSLSVTGSCTSAQFCVWQLPDLTLIPGEKISFRISAKVNASALGGTTTNNSIRVSAMDQANNLAVNTWTDTNTVQAVEEINMSIAMGVTPSQAKVDNNLTFKIQVANLGTNAATNVSVFSSFPSVLDLISVTTSKGSATLNTSARAINVSIGTMISGQVVKIVVVTKVNSSATDIEIYENKAKLYWDPDLSLTSNAVRFRVLPASTLPGTGIHAPPAGAINLGALPITTTWVAAALSYTPVALMILLVGFILALGGLAFIAYSLYARSRRPLWAGRYAGVGLILLVAALACGLAGWALSARQPAAPPQLSWLAGTKPPLATLSPATRLPSPTHKPTKTVNPDDYLPTPTPLSLPDYPIPSPTALVTQGPGGVEPDPSAVTRIVIPAIGLDTVVKFVPYDGQTWMIGGLKQEVAWMGDTSWPGLGGNTGLAGHVDLATGEAGPFWYLKNLQPGDEVILYTEKNVYTYNVRQQVVVNDYDMSVLEQTDDPQVTLITCTGWDDELRTYLQRLVVFADLINVKALPSIQ